ncbi:MAG: hypothetical protein LBR97_10615 [Dysgonamonadaceae bacterium]|nr:hypothetical protein [Dysgonamonadaceae bacterium]
MKKNNTIEDEMFAAVIDGVATNEERRLIYNAIEGSEELRQKFNECMYAKQFEEEIENDFQVRYAGQTLELESEQQEQTTLFNDIFLSVNKLMIDSNNPPKKS